MEQYKLVSSNEHKLREFHRMGLNDIEIEKGRDLPEVASPDISTVALYKSLEAGPGTIIEDTAFNLVMPREDWVGTEIKWNLEDVRKFNREKAVWTVCLAKNNGEYITLYRGHVFGYIVEKEGAEEGFGFDSFFIPYDQYGFATLHELEVLGRKDLYSARARAVELMKKDVEFSENVSFHPIKMIPAWTGTYQNE